MYKYKNEYHMNFVNLGDSRAVILYNNGKFKQITRDHKPDDKIEKDRINKLGGSVIEDSEGIPRIGDLSLSRSFGDADNSPFVSQIPDVFYYKITDSTKFIIMACDGLWDVIHNHELFKLIYKFKSLKKNIATELANEALKRGTMDNVSVIIIEL
jgi:serine/threonine protein phosphatase PrpC